MLRDEQLQDVAASLAAVHELDAGDDHPLGVQFHGVDREPAGVLAPGVALVRLEGLDGEDFAHIVEHRCVDVVVRQVPPAVLRIVADEDVARAPVVGRAVLEPVANGQRRDEQQLGDPDGKARQPARAVEDRGVALVALVDDRGRGAAPEVGRDLVADGLEGPAHDARRDGIDGGRRRERRARRHQAAIDLERHGADPRRPSAGVDGSSNSRVRAA